MSSPDIAMSGPVPRMPRRTWQRRKRDFAERLVRFALRLYRDANDSNLTCHAESELRAAGLYKDDAPYGGLLGGDMLDLITVFTMAGHSGGSASMASDIFEKISRYQPLVPLTGADDEWVEVGTGVFQNRRCGRVFKNADGNAYDIDGRVMEDPDGTRWHTSECRVPVTFPYTPTTEVVRRNTGD